VRLRQTTTFLGLALFGVIAAQLAACNIYPRIWHHPYEASGPPSAAAPKPRDDWGELRQQGVRFVHRGQQVVLIVPADLIFIPGNGRFQPQAKSVLNALLTSIGKFWKAGKITRIGVIAHTDNVGSLSSRRQRASRQADVIASHLWVGGIPADRIYAEGVIDQYPVSSNRTVHGQADNRRIQIEVTGAS